MIVKMAQTVQQKIERQKPSGKPEVVAHHGKEALVKNNGH